jgi:hypothetical protein
MKDLVRVFVENPKARALVVLLLVVPLSIYLGTSTVRRSLLYDFEVFAPSLVLGVAVGLWTWSWKWFGYAIAIGVALTSLTQSLMYLLWR